MTNRECDCGDPQECSICYGIDQQQKSLTQRIEDLEEEWTRLDSTEIPSSAAAMDYYTKRVNSIMKSIADLKKERASLSC